MDNFDIDSYKKSWQEQDKKIQYDSSEILKMLNSKSKNYVKYIAWISLVEFVLFVVLTLYYLFFEENNSSILDLITKFGINKTKNLEADISHLDFIMKMISLLLTGVFVYIFFKNYKKISAEANIKQFILQILNFKKTVKYFIISNITILVIFNGLIIYTIYENIKIQKTHLLPKSEWLLSITIFSTTVISLLLIFIYYKIFYGIILKKLSKNLQQLKEIEQQTTTEEE